MAMRRTTLGGMLLAAVLAVGCGDRTQLDAVVEPAGQGSSGSGSGPGSWEAGASEAGASVSAVLFGGYDDKGTDLSDTWSWNGNAWTSLEVSGPSGRASPRPVW